MYNQNVQLWRLATTAELSVIEIGWADGRGHGTLGLSAHSAAIGNASKHSLQSTDSWRPRAAPSHGLEPSVDNDERDAIGRAAEAINPEPAPTPLLGSRERRLRALDEDPIPQ
jgi:hypothetical protein